MLSKLNSWDKNIWIADLIFLISNFPEMLARSRLTSVLVNLNLFLLSLTEPPGKLSRFHSSTE